jgi:hypothetical protein
MCKCVKMEYEVTFIYYAGATKYALWINFQILLNIPPGKLGFDSRQCKNFLFSTVFRPALGPTQSRV